MTNKEQIWLERKQFVIDFLKNGVMGFILIFIAFGVMAASNVLVDRWSASLWNRTTELNELNAQLTRNMAKLQSINETKRNTTLGVDFERKAHDDAIMLAFLEEYGNWATTDECFEKFKDCRKLYGRLGTLTDVVLHRFDSGYICDADDHRIARMETIDTSMVFHGMESYVVSSSSNTYVYCARISFERMFKGEPEPYTSAWIYYSVDSSGSMSGFSGQFIAEVIE